MAERRMFSKKVTDDDNFMSLSSSAQALYLHLSMSADDDGFSNQVSTSMFKAHASVQDLQALLEKRYIYQFKNGVIVIKHWRMANALRKDRYTPTAFQEELAQLDLKENGSYTWLPDGCQMVAERLPQDRLGKDSVDKDRLDEVSIENPPLPPAEERNFDHYSNVANYLYIQGTSEDEYVNYINIHIELDNCVTSWMEYKDEKKPKTNNHYGKKGMNTLLNKIYTQCLDYGIPEVIRVIEETISNNYQGITWDRLNKPKQNKQGMTDDDWSRV